MDLVSIITPSYNCSKFVVDTIEAIRAQTYTNWELLISDDCSSDNSVQVIEEYARKDSRIKLFKLEKNVGAAGARNNSIREAKGRYIAFCDSDDLWYPEKLEKQINFMKENNYAFTITNYELMSEEGGELNKFVTMPKSLSYSQYMRNTKIGCLTVVIDRDIVGDFEMPCVHIKTAEDMATWLSILKRGYKVFALQECLAKYRLVSNSISANKFKAMKNVWRVYREVEKLNIFYCIFNFCGYAINAVKKRL